MLLQELHCVDKNWLHMLFSPSEDYTREYLLF